MTSIARGLSLIGARGTGKSTVGRLVADGLELPFVDADRLLEERAGRSIAELFAVEGESYFRDLEESILTELHDRAKPVVLATGGGVILRPANRTLLRELGTVVWLSARVETLAERLTRDLAARPALTSAGPIAEIAEIVSLRTPFYCRTAHFSVETDGLDPVEIARIVVERLDPKPLPL